MNIIIFIMGIVLLILGIVQLYDGIKFQIKGETEFKYYIGFIGFFIISILYIIKAMVS